MASNDVIGMSDRLHCRKRLGMYLGSPDNPAIMVREVIDNSIDEVLQGGADSVWVWNTSRLSVLNLIDSKSLEYINNSTDEEIINIKNIMKEIKMIRYTIADSGRGIPIKATTDLSGNTITMTEFAMGSLRSGSKFNKTDVMAGTNGVGTSATNFTAMSFSVYSKLSTQSKRLTTDYVKSIWNNDPRAYYKITFCTGLKVSEEVVLIDDEVLLPKSLISMKTEKLPATITSFVPDPTIWKSQDCRIPMNTKYLKYLLNLNDRDVHFYINDVENTELPKSFEYNFKCHIKNELVETKNPFMDFYVSIGLSEELEEFTSEYSVNTLNTQDGIHRRLLEKSLKAAIKSKFGDLQGYELYGINILCVFACPEPAFASQTKERLADIPGFSSNKEYNELTKQFIKVINANIEAFTANNSRVMELIKSKANWSRLDEIKAKISLVADSGAKKSTAFMPHKLKDCTCKDRTKAELYVCEGRSAASGLCSARAGTNNVAILGLRGKPLNTSGMDITDILENEEMYDLVNAIGCGVNDYHSLDQVRYGKVIIACFNGDTKVKLLDGTCKSFKELTEIYKNGETFDVCSLDENGDFVPAKAKNPRITGYRKQMLKIHLNGLDGDSIVECTPDHKWLKKLGNGETEWVEAKDLIVDDSISTIYTKVLTESHVPYNHRVTKIELCEYDTEIPVYCMEVLDTHNFALDNGCVVHNCDSDPDGYAIANLILGMISQNMTFLLDNGMVYVAVAPLYEQNNKYYYAGDESKIDWSKPVQRYKGLGEVNADKLYDFVMNPKTRRLVKITASNMEYASALLGSTHARKELMVKLRIVSEGIYKFSDELK